MFKNCIDLSDVCNVVRNVFDIMLLKCRGRAEESISIRYYPMASIRLYGNYHSVSVRIRMTLTECLSTCAEAFITL
jgi:hypothetical protein